MQFGLRGPEVGDEDLISRGSITIQFSYQQSMVSLMEYENTRRVRTLSTGPFTIKMIKQINCPILAHICCVDTFKWPLTKDTAVIRVTTRTFVIALPGLLYAIQFPSLCSRGRLRILSEVLHKYAHFQDLRHGKLGGSTMKVNEAGILKRLRPEFEPIAHETVLELGNIPGISRFCIEEQNSSLLRACRMSVITKMIMESMRVKIMTSSLVEIKGTNVNPNEAHQGRAYAVASTYTRLVDALEYASLVSCGLGEELKNVVSPLRFGSVDVGYQFWNLNELGLLSFMPRLGPHVIEEEVKNVTATEEWWNAMARKEEEEAEAESVTEAEAEAGRDNDKKQGTNSVLE